MEGDFATLGDLTGKFSQRENNQAQKMDSDNEDDPDLKAKVEVEDMSRFFLNAEGKSFDPLKKFGSIEDGN
jgi:hypothetical protein